MNLNLSDVSALVVTNKISGILGLKNKSGATWTVSLPDGSHKNVDDDGGMPALPDLKIKFNHDVSGLTTK